MLRRYVDRVCEMMQGPERRSNPPLSVVGALAKDGLELEAAAVDAIADFARTADDTKRGLEAAEALGAIGTARARALLEALASSDAPADVVERARELLRRNSP